MIYCWKEKHIYRRDCIYSFRYSSHLSDQLGVQIAEGMHCTLHRLDMTE